MALWVFYALALVALASAMALVFHPRPMIAGLFMALAMVSVGGLHILLRVPFLGLFQIIIYAGAVMVMVLYILMALGPRESGKEVGSAQFLATVAASGLFLGHAGFVVVKGGAAAFPEVSTSFGSIREFGTLLVEQYAVPFEIASLVLLAAMVGAVVLARREWA